MFSRREFLKAAGSSMLPLACSSSRSSPAKETKETKPEGAEKRAGEVLDVSRLYPLVVPTGYVAHHESFRHPLIDGLDVTLVVDLDGLIQGVSTPDLEATGLTALEAQATAFENLQQQARTGGVEAMAFPSEDGKSKFILWGGHWLAATCILLPGLRGLTEPVLESSSILVSIPHREAMLLFGERDRAWRDGMRKMIREKESWGRKPISWRLLKLGTRAAPYYERSPVSWFDEGS
jgi:hypothetical protein